MEHVVEWVTLAVTLAIAVAQFFLHHKMQEIESNMDVRTHRRTKAFDEELKALNDFYDIYEESYSNTMQLLHLPQYRPKSWPEHKQQLRRFKICIRDKALVLEAEKQYVQFFKAWNAVTTDPAAQVGMPSDDANSIFIDVVRGHGTFTRQLRAYREKLMD